MSKASESPRSWTLGTCINEALLHWFAGRLFANSHSAIEKVALYLSAMVYLINCDSHIISADVPPLNSST